MIEMTNIATRLETMGMTPFGLVYFELVASIQTS